MVRTYKRKTSRQSWSEENMQKAINAMATREMGAPKAATTFSVPQTTLERRFKIFKEDPTITGAEASKKSLGAFKAIFSKEQERELVEYIMRMETLLHGLTGTEVRSIAFQLAEKNKIKHNFNTDRKLAGSDWLKAFLNRNPDLSVRIPESVSVARSMGFNPVAINKFFDLLETTVDKYKFTADRIFNCDETGISQVGKCNPKIIAKRGKKQVGTIASAERGKTVTVEVCMSATGNFMPPMFIFPRVRMKESLLDKAPPNSTAACHPSGWIQLDLFFTWFKQFVTWSRASKENMVLLLLDGHTSHTKNIKVIDYARDNGVVIICFPPHCTHRLQPLDVAFMKPLSTYYSEEVKKWLRLHPGRVITQEDIPGLFAEAYYKAATMKIAMNGFKSTGIWPTSRDVFSECDFIASSVTDIPLDNSVTNADELPGPSYRNMPEDTTNADQSEIMDATVNLHCETNDNDSNHNSNKYFAVTPENILASPKCTVTKRISKNRGKTAVITESPYKRELETKIKEKVLPKSSKKTEVVKRKVDFGRNFKQTTIKKKTKKLKISATEDSNSDSSITSDANCLYCDELYSSSTEGWIQCVECGKWAHEGCAGIDPDDDDSPFTCEICSS